MKIVIMGPKGAGKSTVGRAFAELTGLTCVDTDAQIEAADAQGRTCREIFSQDGADAFRAAERAAAREAAKQDYCVIITGAGLMMDPESRCSLRDRAILVWLSATPEALWQRATVNGVPPMFAGDGGREKYEAQCAHRSEVLRPFADIVLDTTEGSPEDLATTPEKAASIILKAVLRDKRRVMVGPDAYLFDWVTRLFPAHYHRLAVRLMRATSKKRQQSG